MLSTLAAVAVVIAADPAADQSRLAQDSPCYDALVKALIIRQTPTVVPDCDQCIIMEWPYIDDLEVKHVLRGQALLGPLTVLSMQHTYLRALAGGNRWWLRRNAKGGFNVVSIGDAPRPRLCSKNDMPPSPYIEPMVGQTLDKLRDEGDRRNGHWAGQIFYPNQDASTKP